MAGHSHSANIKYRKDRQDSARSQLFIKLRKKLENILREEGKVSEKSLNLARENKFPKERVYQIWEKISQEKSSTFTPRFLYQAPFRIVIYVENAAKVYKEVVNQLKLKELPLSLLPNYFQSIYSLEIELKEKGKKSNSLEEYLLAILPLETWEKVNYNSKEQVLFSSDKEMINKAKSILKENSQVELREKKNSWQTLIPLPLNNQEEKDYYSQLKAKLENIPFYTNVENQ